MSEIAFRFAVGAAGAMAVALLARRTRSLTPGGAAAAVVLGALATAAGWPWAILLISFFFSATLFSRMASERKDRNTAGVAEKGGERDLTQVLANGGLFGLFAVLAVATGSDS